jgi:hypothetical protein
MRNDSHDTPFECLIKIDFAWTWEGFLRLCRPMCGKASPFWLIPLID